MGDKPHDQKVDLVELILEYSEWEPIDSWGNGQIIMSDEAQFTLAGKILERLEKAWDEGRNTGRYDGLYQDPTSWDDEGNPYREE